MNDEERILWESQATRINRIEDKVDELLRFKYWFVGVASAIGSVATLIVGKIFNSFGGHG